jgi:hypothetical protein
MRPSNKNISTFKNVVVQKKNQGYRHAQMAGEHVAVYHDLIQTDYFT